MPVSLKDPIPSFITVLLTILCSTSIFKFSLSDHHGNDKGFNDHIQTDSCAPVISETIEAPKLLSRSKRDVQCPSGWTVFGDNCYLAAKAQQDQPTAEVNCRDSDVHLASIGSTDENNFIQALASYAGIQSVWLGLRYEDNTRWKWLNQVNFNYSNWNDNQPANPDTLRCGILNTMNNGRWETRQCFPATADGYVCMTVTTVTDPCLSTPCLNGGSCMADGSGGSGYSCTCTSGFSGPDCSVVTSACSDNPCLNGGTCVDGGTYYQCNCVSGFTGTDCEQGAPVIIQSGSAISCSLGACTNGGTCVPTPSSGIGFLCTCPPGFSGIRCETSLTCSASSCSNGGTCIGTVSIGNGLQCTCPSGFSGARCEISIGCTVNTCVNGGTCVTIDSSANGFRCACSPGFDGNKCEIDINECTSNPCQNGGTCLDGINQFGCRCSDGWAGSTCSQRISNCSPNPCQHNGQCYALSLTTYICKCADGYVGSQCESDVNECDYGICVKGASCVNTPGSFQCICPSGSTGTCTSSSVQNARSNNPCTSNPCQNGGTCRQSGNTFSCTCVAGYTGSTCQTVMTSCSPNPCVNGGQCSVSGSQMTCSCQSGYSGQYCQYGSSSTTACFPNPCQNGANCTNGQNGAFTCQCMKGYTGRTCAVPCPTGWSWSNSVCYFAENVASNYEQAVALCPRQQPGSYLLTVESQMEFDNAAILMNQLQSDIWMGLKYDVSRSQFVWVTGQAMGTNDFTAWNPQQSNRQQTKNCVRITANAGFVWIMEDCNRSLKLICKYKG